MYDFIPETIVESVLKSLEFLGLEDDKQTILECVQDCEEASSHEVGEVGKTNVVKNDGEGGNEDKIDEKDEEIQGKKEQDEEKKDEEKKCEEFIIGLVLSDHNLLDEIFTKLPDESKGRCQVVCPLWNFILEPKIAQVQEHRMQRAVRRTYWEKRRKEKKRGKWLAKRMLDGETIAGLIENKERLKQIKGTVFNTDANGALVDITAKSSAYLPVREASIHRIKHVEESGIVPGLREEFVIVGENEADDCLILSLRSIQYDLAWERCRQLQAEDVVVKCKVVGANKGGVAAVVEGLHVNLNQKSTAEELLDKELPLKFVEVDEEQSRLVLSNRKAMADSQARLGIGSVVLGTVQSLTPYDAFIDIGGIYGLLHVSQISHDRVSDIATFLQPGDTLKVHVCTLMYLLASCKPPENWYMKKLNCYQNSAMVDIFVCRSDDQCVPSNI
ncbi:hypothetical protein Pfo_025906 [Paulownia fortunei]|nr:hypothetical protein Pfo_025906 [Paulownia fortunei]